MSKSDDPANFTVRLRKLSFKTAISYPSRSSKYQPPSGDHRRRIPVAHADTAFIERVNKLNKQSRRLKNPWRF
jgi:hypothetical protein